jgi:DHA2 family multidrug resistance protein-like MFS transporter
MDVTAATVDAPARAGAREWVGLAVIALPCLLYSMDLTVLNLATPRLAAALRPSGPELLWILDVYSFLLAGFLLPMGSLGDRIGRRRLLMIGAVAFGLASVVAAFSPSAIALIAARAVLGVAAATLAPSTLSLIRNMFLDARQRTTAIGIWAASFAAGTAIGPLLGGLLLLRFWWGSVFLLAVPVMALLLLLAPHLLPEYRDPQPGRPDWAGAGLSLAAVLLAIFGIKQFAEGGAPAIAAAAVLGGAALGAAFVRRQLGLADPLLDLRLFRVPAFGVALATNLLVLFALDGAFLFVAQYVQLVAGLSPWQAALWMLPWAGGLVAGSLAGPLLTRWLEPRVVVVGSLLLAAFGFALLAGVGGAAGLLVAAAGSALSSLGISPAVPIATDLVVGAVPPGRAGAASGMTETSTELGGALGVALVGSAGLAVYRSVLVPPPGLPSASLAAARDTLAGALAVAGGLPGTSGTALARSARDAFTQGLHLSGLVSAAIVLALAVLVATPLARHRPTSEGEESDR